MKDIKTGSKKGKDTMQTTELKTTLGDLICAIAEAAEESAVDEQDLAQITHMILGDILSLSAEN